MMKTVLAIASLLATELTAEAGYAEEKQIFLTSRASNQLAIGRLDLYPAGDDFSIDIDGGSFVELYMEDRNFKCLAEEAWHYCYLPYVSSGHFAYGRYAALEHALLFVRKSKNDVDLNPFNGIYDKIAKDGATLAGKPRVVDLAEIEAASSQRPGTPIKDEDLNLGQPEDCLIPLTID
jgi:hypothetical protein